MVCVVTGERVNAAMHYMTQEIIFLNLEQILALDELTAIPRRVRSAIINRAENAGNIGCQHVKHVGL